MDHNTFKDDFINKILDKGEFTIMKGQTETFGKGVNVKQFLGELNELLINMKYKDKWQVKNHVKEGEFVDPDSGNRTGNMYETKYVSIKKGYADELEIVWEAQRKLPETDFGSVHYTLDLVNRFMIDKEITDEDGNKKKVQDGGWEFRNKIIYKNNVVKEKLSKIPFIKNSVKLQRMYLEIFYYKQLEADFLWCLNRTKAQTNGILYKYFA